MLSLSLALLAFLSPLDEGRVVVVGHRGAPADYPESTLVGFAHAWRAAAAVELDVRVTRDDVLVVHHDATVSPRCSRRAGERIRALTFAELRAADCGAADRAVFPRQRPVPGAQLASLDELLASAPPAGFVIIELKTDDAPAPDALARLVVAALDRARPALGGARGRVVVESFGADYVRALQRIAPDVATGLLVGDERAQPVADAAALGVAVLSIVHTRVDAALVDAAHARQLLVLPWTVNDVVEQRRLIALGVDAIVTDDPHALARLRERAP